MKPAPYDLPGWTWTGDRFETVETVAGYVTRGETLQGTCRELDCRRAVKFDLPHMNYMRQGAVDVKLLKATWLCGREGGCKLTWGSTYPRGCPLQTYVTSGGTITVHCKGCDFSRRYGVQELIDRLHKQGAGGGNTSVHAIAEAIRGACPKCKQTRWAAKFEWPTAPGAGSLFHAEKGPRAAEPAPAGEDGGRNAQKQRRRA